MFSVIVPLYNKVQYIRRCLDSIVTQTFGDVELIVVNDGSTDGSELCVKDYIDQNPERRICLLNGSNRGPGAARNRGIAASKGEYVAFLDADDAWLPEYLFSVKRTFDRFPNVAAVTVGYFEYPAETSQEHFWRRRGLTDGLQRVTQTTVAMELAHMLAYMTPSTTVVKKEIVTKWNGFVGGNARYGEDAALFLKILLNEPVFYSFKPLVQIDRAASSLSTHCTLRGVEPFLADSNDIVQACPNALRSVLQEFCSIRAYKTAAVLGLWGQWRIAARLVKKFGRLSDWTLPYFCWGLVGCTPFAQLARYPVIALRQKNIFGHWRRRDLP